VRLVERVAERVELMEYIVARLGVVGLVDRHLARSPTAT
jgi:hypothetical protein